MTTTVTLLVGADVVDLTRDASGDTYARWTATRSEQLETRPCTTEESAQLTVATNGQTIRDKAAQALAINKTYLALNNPTNAQNVAQVRALTRECNALVRLLLGLLDDAADT